MGPVFFRESLFHLGGHLHQPVPEIGVPRHYALVPRVNEVFPLGTRGGERPRRDVTWKDQVPVSCPMKLLWATLIRLAVRRISRRVVECPVSFCRNKWSCRSLGFVSLCILGVISSPRTQSRKTNRSMHKSTSVSLFTVFLILYCAMYFLMF